MNIPITNDVRWAGKIDWELRKFHGDEYSTHRGSTYNSYLVRAGEKNVLIDTVWAPFATEYLANLKTEVDLRTIAAVVVNHAESDHSGALPDLLREIPDTPVYCTKNGVKSLTGHYHTDWNFKIVKTGDRFSLNGKEFIFVEAPMLHWPDSMMCYLAGDNVLFSNDAFGQHYASESMFNDLVPGDELFSECIKYYANILTPFSAFVEKKIKEVLSLNLPIAAICPSHGVIWRKNPAQIIEKYISWAKEYRENQITIIYDTMWGGTRRMAEEIGLGIHASDPAVAVKLFSLSKTDKNDVATEIFKSKGVIVGSPTVNRGILSSVAGFLEEVRGLGFQGKKAAAFGAYGWSGESVATISDLLKKAGFDVVQEGLKSPWQPDDTALVRCREFGSTLAPLMPY